MRLRTRLAAGFFVAVCFSTLVGRLWYLQIHEYDFYAQRAAGQQLRDSVVPAPRLAAGFFVAVCFSTLVGRLWYLQIHEYDFYAQRAAGQQLRDSVVPAPRGDILDANGTPLAVSASCWTIRAVPREMADPGRWRMRMWPRHPPHWPGFWS